MHHAVWRVSILTVRRQAGALAALNSGALSSYAADVFESEPPAAGHALLQHPNFHGTPHIGASTAEAQNRVGAEIVQSVLGALKGEVPAGKLVNRDVKPRSV